MRFEGTAHRYGRDIDTDVIVGALLAMVTVAEVATALVAVPSETFAVQ